MRPSYWVSDWGFKMKMKTVYVTRDEICEAIELNQKELVPGTFVNEADATSGTYTKHCGVCAVGAVFHGVSKLNKMATKAILKFLKEEYKEENHYANFEECVEYAFNSELYRYIGDSCTKGIDLACQYDEVEDDYDSVEDNLEDYLKNKHYLAALSIFFEDYLEKGDAPEFKAGCLQGFVLTHFPKRVPIQVPAEF